MPTGSALKGVYCGTYFEQPARRRSTSLRPGFGRKFHHCAFFVENRTRWYFGANSAVTCWTNGVPLSTARHGDLLSWFVRAAVVLLPYLVKIDTAVVGHRSHGNANMPSIGIGTGIGSSIGKLVHLQRSCNLAYQ